jgi:enamine deaminase RidA (YjgF/YER057c/UK114 family)
LFPINLPKQNHGFRKISVDFETGRKKRIELPFACFWIPGINSYPISIRSLQASFLLPALILTSLKNSANSIIRHGVTRRWADAVVHQGTAYFVEVPDDPSVGPASQFQMVLDQVDRRLQAVGSDRTRLLQVTIYLPNPKDLASFNQLWDAWIPEGHAPSRACLHSQLVSPDYHIELVITAALA